MPSSTPTPTPVPSYVSGTWAPISKNTPTDTKINSLLPPQIYLDQTSFSKYGCSSSQLKVKQTYNNNNGTFNYTLINYCNQVNSTTNAVLNNQNPSTKNNNSQFTCDGGNNYLKLQIDTKGNNLPYFYCGTARY